MKKSLSILLTLCLICVSAVGCSDSDRGTPRTESPAPEVNIDVDLSRLSDTIAFAELNNMLENPDEHLGKIVKVRGVYFPSFFDETAHYYHFVVVGDAAACCQAGLEFIWNGDHMYPEDYPQAEANIEIIGVFGMYEELGVSYKYLAVDDITVLDS